MNVASEPNATASTQAPPPAAAEAERKTPRASLWRSPRGETVRAWLRTGTGLFASAITLMAATLTVVFLLVPSLKPSAPAAEFGATLSDARIETGVGVGDYYRRIGQQPPATLSRDDLAITGVVVSFTVTIEGYKDKACGVVWSVFEAGTNKRVAWEWLAGRPGWPAKQFIPAGNKDQGNGEIFVQNPPAPGTYLVRVELNDPNGTRLATIDSPTFTVTGTASAPPAIGLPTATGS